MSVIIRQEPFVNGTHQEMVRQAGGLGPHEEKACGDVDGLTGKGDETQVLPRLAEPYEEWTGLTCAPRGFPRTRLPVGPGRTFQVLSGANLTSACG